MAGANGLKIAILLGNNKLETLGRARALLKAAQSARPLRAHVSSFAIGLPVEDEAIWRSKANWLIEGASHAVVRRMSWERVLAENARRMFSPLDVPVSLQGIERVTLPRDWGSNFLDCDYWLLIAGAEIGGVYPARPTAVFCSDLAARRAPTAFSTSISEPYWEDQTAAFRMWRQSSVAVASDPLTAADLTSYAGVRPEQVLELSEPLDLPLPNALNQPKRDLQQLLVRVEPDDDHGVHVVFNSLRQYAAEGGRLKPVIASEALPEAFGSRLNMPQIVCPPELMCRMITSLPTAQLTSHERWARLLAQSGSAWITRRVGGDGRSLREALRSGIPTLSPDSPIARHTAQKIGGSLTLIPPVTVDGLVDALHAFEASVAMPVFGHARTPNMSRLCQEIGFVLDRLQEASRD